MRKFYVLTGLLISTIVLVQVVQLSIPYIYHWWFDLPFYDLPEADKRRVSQVYDLAQGLSCIPLLFAIFRMARYLIDGEKGMPQGFFGWPYKAFSGALKFFFIGLPIVMVLGAFFIGAFAAGGGIVIVGFFVLSGSVLVLSWLYSEVRSLFHKRNDPE